MRLAVSNIAWPAGGDDLVAPVLLEGGAEGVEIAPTKVWPRPLEASAAEVRSYRDSWERRGLRVVALQALLFGRPELRLFGDDPERRQTLAYLEGMIDLANALGADALVFGSPRNRQAGTRPRHEIDAIALASFRALGRHASARSVRFCIEANPAVYGCDFITTTAEAADLVDRVGSEGFGLHIDTGGMTLSGEDPALVLGRSDLTWRHFHVSEPHLAPIGLGNTDHQTFGQVLRRRHAGGWISIEMKEATDGVSNVDALRQSIRHTLVTYSAESDTGP